MKPQRKKDEKEALIKNERNESRVLSKEPKVNRDSRCHKRHHRQKG